jgi:hypothetical protein
LPGCSFGRNCKSGFFYAGTVLVQKGYWVFFRFREHFVDLLGLIDDFGVQLEQVLVELAVVRVGAGLEVLLLVGLFVLVLGSEVCRVDLAAY